MGTQLSIKSKHYKVIKNTTCRLVRRFKKCNRWQIAAVHVYKTCNVTSQDSVVDYYLVYNKYFYSFYFPPVDVTCCESVGERFENFLRLVFSCWGSFCVRRPLLVIFVSIVLVVICCFGLRYMRITTDPVDLWSAPQSRARQEKQYFDEHFGPFFRTEQLIITTPWTNWFTFESASRDIPFAPILNISLLHQVRNRVYPAYNTGFSV